VVVGLKASLYNGRRKRKSLVDQQLARHPWPKTRGGRDAERLGNCCCAV